MPIFGWSHPTADIAKNLGESAFDGLASLDDLPDSTRIFQKGDIVQRIAVNQNEIGKFPLLDGSNLLIQSEERGRGAGGSLNGLHRCKPELHHPAKLLRIASVRIEWRSGVGAHGYPHTGLGGFSKIRFEILGHERTFLKRMVGQPACLAVFEG